MTSSMAFRCVQAWLLEKPAAWVGEDTPSLAAALMAQRPPMRPREDALLEAERLYHRRLIAHLDEELIGEIMRCEERERDNRNLRWQQDRHIEIIEEERGRAVRAEARADELEEDVDSETIRCEELGWRLEWSKKKPRSRLS